jgi:hypothetical protein
MNACWSGIFVVVEYAQLSEHRQRSVEETSMKRYTRIDGNRIDAPDRSDKARRAERVGWLARDGVCFDLRGPDGGGSLLLSNKLDCSKNGRSLFHQRCEASDGRVRVVNGWRSLAAESNEAVVK